jgi:long-chain acyl-CoA synthetase
MLIKPSKKVALMDDYGLSLTYSDLVDFVSVVGSYIDTRGLLLLKCDNSLASISFYVASLELKVPIMLIDEKIAHNELAAIVDEYKPHYLIIQGDEVFSDLYENKYSYGGLSVQSRKIILENKISKELALLLSTSGSTGSRKFVRLSYDNILSNTASIVNYLGVTPLDVAITTLPMSYTFGLSIINTHLYASAKIIVTKFTALEKDFWLQMSRQRVTSLSGVPYSFELMMKTGLLKRSLPDVKVITQAGGKLSSNLKIKLLDYCDEFQKKLFVMYGQTEASPRMSFVPPYDLRNKIDSIGVSISGGSLEIRSEDGVLCKTAEHGEIIYKGPNVSLGYSVCVEDLAVGDTLGGVLSTGDVGYVDKDGFYFIVGRNKRFAKVFGLRVSLDEIEELLISKYPDFDFMCKVDESVIIVYFSDGSLDVADAKKFISYRSKIHRTGFKFEQIAKIKRNSSGKKLYNA